MPVWRRASWAGLRRWGLLVGLATAVSAPAAGEPVAATAEPAPAHVAPQPVPAPSAAAVTAPAQPSEPALPARPDDPRAAKVYTALETHCARCHQSGRTEKSVPAGGVANILALGDLASNARLVRPGVPDASRLYEVMLTRHAPLDVYASAPERREPAADELGAVREWIREMPGRTAACSGRTRVRDADVEGWIEEALRAEREGARDLRFVSLVTLHNACVPGGELAAARQSITKLLNGLSWGAAPVKLTAVDPDGTLLSFRLADLGWVAGHWETLQRAYPKALVMPLSEKTRSLGGAANPVVRGDWLADAVSDAKLYYQLLGTPQTLAELARMNGVDIDHNIRTQRARRAIVRQSDVTRGNRLAERHPGARGGFWLMYDFASSSGDQDLFERPLGPRSGGIVRAPFKPDIQRVIFALPNGFLAYALYDASGNRIDRVPPGIEKPAYAGAGERGSGGGGCFSCHGEGIRSVRDDYRAFASADTAQAGKEVREAALQLAATDGELVLLRDADNERYRNALVAAGVDPRLTLAGEEVVSALARRYRLGADYDAAALELGLERAVFEAALSKATGPVLTLAHRLQQGPLARAELDQIFAYLKGVEAPPAPAQRVPDVSQAGRIALDLWTDKARPAIGDLISVNVQSDTDCYLTVVNIDVAGKATVIFPNDFEADNLISAGKIMRVPGSEAPYQLRRKEEGREMIFAQCSTSPAPPTGIDHEFSRQRFTVLGNWENFVEDALVTDADLRTSPEKAERARRTRALAARRERGARNSAIDRGDTAPGRTLVDGRAVIVIE